MKKTKNISNVLFMVAYILLTMSYFMNRVPAISNVLNIFKWVGIVILVINCISQSRTYNTRTFLFIIALVAINFISYYFSRESTLLILTLIVLSAKNIHPEEFIKKDIILKIIIIIVLFILFKMGLTNESLFFKDGIQRHTFGFSHPNRLGALVSSIIIELIFLNKEKLNIFRLIIYIVIAYFAMTYTISRSSFLITLIAIMIFLIPKKYLKNILYNPLIKIIIKNSWIILTAIMLFVAFLYNQNNDLINKLDILLSGRINLITKFMDMYPITILGQKIIQINTDQAAFLGVRGFVLDNAYIRMLLENGVIMFLLFSYLLRKVFKYAYKKENLFLIAILFLQVIYGLSEHICYVIFMNVFLIYMSRAIYDANERKIKTNED